MAARLEQLEDGNVAMSTHSTVSSTGARKRAESSVMGRNEDDSGTGRGDREGRKKLRPSEEQLTVLERMFKMRNRLNTASIAVCLSLILANSCGSWRRDSLA